jgi:hypothetical protein
LGQLRLAGHYVDLRGWRFLAPQWSKAEEREKVAGVSKAHFCAL